jgi:hypothetical protein
MEKNILHSFKEHFCKDKVFLIFIFLFLFLYVYFSGQFLQNALFLYVGYYMVIKMLELFNFIRAYAYDEMRKDLKKK